MWGVVLAVGRARSARHYRRRKRRLYDDNAGFQRGCRHDGCDAATDVRVGPLVAGEQDLDEVIGNGRRVDVRTARTGLRPVLR